MGNHVLHVLVWKSFFDSCLVKTRICVLSSVTESVKTLVSKTQSLVDEL